MNRKQMLRFLLLNSDTVGGTLKGVPPLTYKAKEAGFLTNYRIYGQTVNGESVGDRTANLFDMKTFAETCFQHSATVNYTNNTLTFTATSMDAYVNGALSTGGVLPLHYRSSCVDVMPSTTYTISMSTAPKCFISWIDNSFNVVSGYTTIPTNATSYIFTTPENCTKILIRLGKQVENIGDTFVISNIMLNEGVTPLPYEPYGYKVPVTVEGKNLFDYDTIMHGYRIQWRTGENYADETAIMSDFISVSENSTYATDTKLYWLCYDANKQYIGAWDGSDIVKSGVDAINSMTAISPCKFIRILSFSNKVTPISSTTMLNCGSTALPYEPYHTPITTPIYLPEPIKMVGDKAEYIEYGTQKMYRIGADDLDVTLPALPTLTGTNVLSVGTEIQPSMAEVMGRIKAVPTN